MMTTLQLPLGSRPRLVNYGLAEHGHRAWEEYKLPRLWCLHLFFYQVEIEVDGRVYSIVPGSLTLIPPDTRILYKFERKRLRHFFVHFTVASRGPRVPVPLLQHLPAGRDEILDRLQNIQRLMTRNALHAETLFWGLLWDVAEAGRRRPEGEEKNVPQLEAIESFIERQLPGKISVAKIARQVGWSPVHVNRVLRKLIGMTTVQLIRKRRLQRAYRLLLHSTLPIKFIASECGIEDLQQFNKLMRGSYGRSPRQLRTHAPEAGDSTWALDRQ